MSVLDWVYYGNTVKTWIIALAAAALVLVFLEVSKTIISRRLAAFAQRTETEIGDIAADLVGKTRFFFLLALSAYTGTQVLTLPEVAARAVSKFAVLAGLAQTALWGNGLFTHYLARYAKQRMVEDNATATTMAALGFIGRIVLWTVIVLVALDNLGVEINSLIAGLGIGGIAVALAVQNVLGDLLASLSIILDKPFVVGDFIVVDSFRGTVEHVGLKTTRVRSIEGEQIIFSNADLLNSRIRNYKRMTERRVVFTLGVTYQTPYERLAAIPSLLQEIIESHQGVRFDRAHFSAYGPYALNFEVVYFVTDPDFKIHMDLHQSINLAVFQRFEREGIQFAYPTQMVFIHKP